MKPEPGSHEADLIVVGGGGSGLSAAIEAAESGAGVILIEKQARLGGSTGWSVGSISSSQTRHQIRAGISDNPQHHFEDLGAFCGALEPRDNRDLRRLLVENVPETFRWLEESGVRFFGPMPEPPHRVPRMHNVVPSSGSFVYHLSRRARRAGVSIRTSTKATALLQANGRVVGVAAEIGQSPCHFHARRGVILAGGDYSGPGALRHAQGPPGLEAVPGVNGTNTGDCQELAMAIGGRLVNADLINGPVLRFVPPARPSLLARLPPHPALTSVMAWALHALPSVVVRPFVAAFLTTVLGPSLDLFANGAALVDSEGNLIEASGTGRDLGRAVAQAPGDSAYVILDRPLAARFSQWPFFVSTAPGLAYAFVPDYKRSRRDLVHEASSLNELAIALRMSPARLAAAVERSNQGGGTVVPSAGAERLRIGSPPFLALGPIRSYVVLTDGGLAVSNRLEVLGDGGQPIAGLYAAGATGQGGLVLAGHGHHLGWAFTSGRLAARFALAQSLPRRSSRGGLPIDGHGAAVS